MKVLNILLLTIFTFVMTNCENTNGDAASTDKSATADNSGFYQLKVYTFDSVAQISVIDQYLKDAFLPGLKRLGINNIGVFKLKSDSIQKTFVLIPVTSIDQFLTLDDKLGQDAQYVAAGSAYINASYEKPPYHRIESTLLKPLPGTPFMTVPTFDSPRSERVYELRSYESATEKYFKNKVEMFTEGGETKLFDRLEFNPVFYGEVISGSKMPNIMYMTTFRDQASRDKHWDAFNAAPEWKALSAMPKYGNNISHIDFMFLYPTEYSDY